MKLKSIFKRYNYIHLRYAHRKDVQIKRRQAARELLRLFFENRGKKQ